MTMSKIESISYHVKVPTLDEVQAVVPFDIDPIDPRTAAWYLLGVIYGRDNEKIWTSSAERGGGIRWDLLDTDEPIIGMALSLSGVVVYGAENYSLMQSVATLPAEQMLTLLTALALSAAIQNVTWEPTQEVHRVWEEARRAMLPPVPESYDDTSPRAEE